LLLEQVHLPAEQFPGLLASDLEHNSLYDLLTERYGTHITRVRESLEPVLLRAREARLLGRLPRSPALLVEGIAFASTGIPVEFGRTYVRGDRTRYYVERVVVRAQPRKEELRRLPIGARRVEVARRPEDREEETAIVTRSIP
jgi:GntR family transcriptional regulator